MRGVVLWVVGFCVGTLGLEILSVSPFSGSTAGGEVINITGSFPSAGASIAVKIGDFPCYDAIIVDSSTVMCETAFVSDSDSGPQLVSIAIDEDVHRSEDITFTYLGQTIRSVFPGAIISDQQTEVTIYGDNLNITGSVVTASCEVASDGSFSFDGDTTQECIVSSLTAESITCTMPALPEGDYEIRCSTDSGATHLYGYPELLSIKYFSSMVITQISPKYGPTSGGTSVTIFGFGLVVASSATAPVYCKFNDTIVQATGWSDVEIDCKTPMFSQPGPVSVRVTVNGGLTEADFSATSIQFVYLDPPNFISASPLTGPNFGTSLLTFVATLPSLTHDEAAAALDSVLSTFRFGDDANVSPPEGNYDILNFAGNQIPYQLTKEKLQYVQATISVELSNSSATEENLVTFQFFSPPHPAGTVDIRFSWDLENYFSTGYTFSFSCESYTNQTLCIADTKCGWCIQDIDSDTGVCAPLDQADPTNYVSALQSSTHILNPLPDRTSCVSGFGWRYTVVIPEFPRYITRSEMLLFGTSRTYLLYFPSSFKRSRVIISSEPTESYPPTLETDINAGFLSKFSSQTTGTGFRLVSIKKSFVCGSLCPFLDGTPATASIAPAVPSITLAQVTSSSVNISIAWTDSIIDATISEAYLQFSPNDQVFDLTDGLANDSEFKIFDVGLTSFVGMLSEDTNYNVRLVLVNSAGTSAGNWLAFSTPSLSQPVVTTLICASETTAASPNNQFDGFLSYVPVNCKFPAQGQSLTELFLQVNSSTGALLHTLYIGNPQQTTSRSVSGLEPETDYSFALFATNSVSSEQVATFSFTTAPIKTEIEVYGAGLLIANASSTATVETQTLFQEVALGFGSEVSVFLIKNAGFTELNLEQGVSIDTSAFTIVSPPSKRIAPGGAAYIDVVFTPDTLGVHTGILNVGGLYWFTLEGVGVAPDDNSALSSMQFIAIRNATQASTTGDTFYVLQYDLLDIFPTFSLGTTSYAALVGSDVDGILVQAAALSLDAFVNVEIDGQFSSGSELQFGANQFDITVTAQDQSTTTYTLVVMKLGGGLIISLSSSFGEFYPQLSPTTFEYHVDIENSIQELSLEIETSLISDSILFNGTVISDKTLTINIDNTTTEIVLVVTQAESITNTTYTLIINRADEPSHDASLSSLTTSVGTIVDTSGDPFASTTLAYNLVIFNITTEVVLSFEPTIATSVIEIEGQPAVSPFILTNVTEGSTFMLQITAEDGVTTNLYILTILHGSPESIASLASLVVFRRRTIELVPSFDPAVFEYAATVDKITNVLFVLASSTHRGARFVINGVEPASGEVIEIGLPLDTSVVTVIVTAEDQETSLQYRISITRIGYTTVSSLSTGNRIDLSTSSELPSEVVGYAKRNFVPTEADHDLITESQSSPFMLLINDEPQDLVECIDGIGCDIAFFSVVGSNRHEFFASDTVGNEVAFVKKTMSIYNLVVIPEFFYTNFTCQGRNCPVSYNGAASYDSVSGSIILSVSTPGVLGSESVMQASSAWINTRPYLADGFEFRFSFKVSEPSLPSPTTAFFSTDEYGNIVDGETGLSPSILLDERDMYSLEGNFEPLPISKTQVSYEGCDLQDETCSPLTVDPSLIGGEGFAFVLQNTGEGLEAIGCTATGIGYTANDLGCENHLDRSVVVEFLTFYNVSRVDIRGHTDSVNGTFKYAYQKRNVINVYELQKNSTKRPDASASFQIPEHLLVLDDGRLHTIRVTHDANEMCIFLNIPAVKARNHVEWQNLMCAQVETMGDILVEDGTANVGFTASTGLGTQSVRISSLEFCSVVGCGERSNTVFQTSSN